MDFDGINAALEYRGFKRDGGEVEFGISEDQSEFEEDFVEEEQNLDDFNKEYYLEEPEENFENGYDEYEEY